MSTDRMRPFLDALLRSGAATSAVALAGTAERIEWEVAAGEARPGIPPVPVTPETRFDYASLTKPFTATLALALDEAGDLPLATRLREIWPKADPRLGRRTLADLLRHRAGLAAWRPLYHLCRSREEVLALLLGASTQGTPAGTYSDLDFLLYGMTVEKALGRPFHELLRVLAPLGLTHVEPSPGDQPDVAESRMDTAKEALLASRQGIAIPPLPPPPPGLPQDGNCRFLVGLAGTAARMTGHAGLFGRARDLWALGAEWLAPSRLLKPEAVSTALGGGGRFALGWWRRTLDGSAGRALPPGSFGHTGFTGGSLWIDPQAGRILVLLSSRADPSCDINRWRRRFHRLALTRIPTGGREIP